MYRVRAKTADKKTLAGPSGADSFVGAVTEAVEAAEAAGKEITQIFVKSTEGVGPGIRLTEPRAKKGESKGKRK